MVRVVLLWIVLTGCSTSRRTLINETARLKLVSQYEIPYETYFNGTHVGGISGIDYNVEKDIFYMVSDDPSAINPARFYTARIRITDKTIKGVEILKADSFRLENGDLYPPAKVNPQLSSDPESIRYDPVRKQIIWTSEGEKRKLGDAWSLQDPQVNVTDMSGRLLRKYDLPINLRSDKKAKGPRHNSSFEGFCFDEKYEKAYVAMEAPLIEDGLEAGLGDSIAYVRITEYHAASGKPLRQFAYMVEPVAYPPAPAGGFRINGITEILWAGNDKLLVVERSFSTGRKECTVRFFLAYLSGAKDISGTGSLAGKNVMALKKKLLLNSDSLGIFIDNIEGVCFGPELAGGKKSLIVVVDNNFSAEQRSQVLLFELN